MAQVVWPGPGCGLLSRAGWLGRVFCGLALMLGVLVGVVGSTGWAWADCGALRAAAATAQSAAQTGQLESIYEQVRVEPSCDEAFRTEFGRLVGRTIEREVYAAVNAGQPLAGFEPKLVRSLSYARQWRPLAWLGDITRERRQYEQSCGYYQDALAAIQDETATPKPPPKEVIEKIFHLAEETRLLAKTYVAPPKTRAGTVTGLGAPSVRGFVPHKVAVPVEYEFDSTAFTTKGQAAAEDLASQLRQQTPTQPITLIGHTDPRGDDAYNRPLSKRRALALRQFLVQSGVQTEIIAEGRGSDEPAAIDDASKYTQDERYQLDRRVEVQR